MFSVVLNGKDRNNMTLSSKVYLLTMLVSPGEIDNSIIYLFFK